MPAPPSYPRPKRRRGGDERAPEHQRTGRDEIEQLRAERDALQAQLATLHRRRRRAGEVRRVTVAALVVLACLSLTAATVAVWADRTLLTTDGWVATVGPLGAEPAVAAALQPRITDAVFSAIPAEGLIADALPDDRSFLAAPLASAVEGYVDDQVGAFLASDRSAQLWVDANRVSHERALAVLRGDSDVRAGRVRHGGARPSARHQPGPGRAEPGGLVIAAPVLVVAAVWLSRNRRRTILQLTFGSVLLLVLVRRVVLRFKDDRRDAPGSRRAGRPPGRDRPGGPRAVRSPAAVIAVAVTVMVIAPLTGPYRWAVALRRGTVQLGRTVWDSGGRLATTADARGLVAWSVEHRQALQIGGAS